MQRGLFFAAMVVAVANAGPLSNGSLGARVSGWENATIEQYPYTVTIEWESFFYCGGSIISPSYVVTLTRCAQSGLYGNLTVRAGSTSSGKDGSVHKVEKIILHEKFGKQGNYSVNDIALLKVSPLFVLDNSHQPIGLFEEEVRAGSEGVLTSWCRAESELTSEKTLRSISSSVLGRHDCTLEFQKIGALPNGVICSGAGDNNVCFEDYGAPFAINGRLAGITSMIFSLNLDCTDRKPLLYTNVAYHRDWIAKHLDA